MCPGVRGEANAVGDPHGGPPPLRTEHLHGKQTCPEGEPGRSEMVVRGLGDRACDMSSVTVVVAGVGRVVDEVEARAAPGVGQVAALGEGIVVLAGDARVDHGHRHAAPGCELPGGRSPHALHVPLLFQQGVVGNPAGIDLRDGLDVLHAVVPTQPGDQRGHASERHGDAVESRARGEHAGGLEGDRELLAQRVELRIGEIVLQVDRDDAG